MSDVENPREPGQAQRAFPWRTGLRVVLGIYLVTLPACTQNAGHLGPGFFPLIAALFLVPLFTVIALADALYGWIEAAGSSGPRSKWVAPVLVSLVAAGYCAIIVIVVLEKVGR